MRDESDKIRQLVDTADEKAANNRRKIIKLEATLTACAATAKLVPTAWDSDHKAALKALKGLIFCVEVSFRLHFSSWWCLEAPSQDWQA